MDAVWVGPTMMTWLLSGGSKHADVDAVNVGPDILTCILLHGPKQDDVDSAMWDPLYVGPCLAGMLDLRVVTVSKNTSWSKDDSGSTKIANIQGNYKTYNNGTNNSNYRRTN